MKAQREKKVQGQIHELSCPFCGKAVEVGERELVDGGTVQCPHCRDEATLSSEWVAASARYQWALLEPENDDER